MSELLDTALSYAARGLHVFPCKPREKEPAVHKGLQAATTDQNIIRGWWRSIDHNIGLRTGECSGIFVVDIDGQDGEAALAKLETEHCPLPLTIESITGKGRHLFFQWPGRKIPNSASKIASRIDVRGDGGYVLAAPSIHPSGKAYEWKPNGANGFAAAPDWIITRATAANFSSCGGPTDKVPASQWGELIASGVEEGKRDCTITSLAGYLLRRYVDPGAVLALMLIWNTASCRPPLPDSDVIRIVNSIVGKELKRRRGFGH
jgi:hypothetical protein